MILILMIALMLSCSSDDHKKVEQQAPIETVVYLIRHAEKADNSSNPSLSEAGLQRADNWATMFQNVSFDVFYSTNYNRTLQTIQPVATANGKEVTVYDHSNFSLENVISQHAGKNVFIVGHSNTIPQLINSYLGGEIYPDIAENEYGNLYKVRIVDGVLTHGVTVHN